MRFTNRNIFLMITVLFACATVMQSCQRKNIRCIEETIGFPVKGLINPERYLCQWEDVDGELYQIEIYDVITTELEATLSQNKGQNGLHKYSERDEELFQYATLYPPIKNGCGYCNHIKTNESVLAVFIDTLNNKLIYYSKFM